MDCSQWKFVEMLENRINVACDIICAGCIRFLCYVMCYFFIGYGCNCIEDMVKYVAYNIKC